MKNILFMFVFFMAAFFVYASELDNFATTLIIIEERENGEFVSGRTPFANGVFDAMWEKPYIFFDKRIDNPIPFAFETLDIRPYIQDARATNADALLLIKFNYETEKAGGLIQIDIDKVHYTFYSMKDLKTLRSGERKIKMSKVIDNNSKNQIIRNLGQETLNYIYK